jgi:hypothetical protein
MWEDSAVAENLGIKIWSFWVIGYNQLKHWLIFVQEGSSNL